MPLRPEHENSKDNTAEATVKASADNSNSPLLQEFWQSLKYTAIQQPYDGIAQAVNHFGGNIAKRNLVDAPDVADVGSSQWIAQQAGSGVAKLGGVLLLHRGMSFAGAAIGARTASTVALGESVATGRITVGSLATAGGIYEGLFTKSGENFFTDRLGNAAIGGTSMYIMGKAQLGMQGLNSVKNLAGQLSEGLSGTVGRQAMNGATGFLAGAAGGAFSAETSSLLKHGKLASPSELAEKTFSSAVMGGVFGTVTKPAFENVSYPNSSTQRTGGIPSAYLEPVPARMSSSSGKIEGPDFSLLGPRSALPTEVVPLRTPPAGLKPLPEMSTATKPSSLPRKMTDQHTPQN